MGLALGHRFGIEMSIEVFKRGFCGGIGFDWVCFA